MSKPVMSEPVLSEAGLPVGFGISLDPSSSHPDQRTLVGGVPRRVLRLSDGGVLAWRELQRGPVESVGAAVLARRLTDAGLAHPVPPATDARPDVTVIIPVRDRPELLERCLSSLGRGHPVLVVDDGSLDARPIASTAAAHGARVLRCDVNGGPAAARNAGLGQVATELVAFLDSDCEPRQGWIEQLAPQLDDPLVAAIAPRIVALPAVTPAGRYAAANGALDLGPNPARVMPATRVAYVPTAALLVRRSALTKLGVDPFDVGLRYGEDVDLIWRLHEQGWRVRYDPAVTVGHREPSTWAALLLRRLHYGTSAGPLARRHPDSLAPLVLQPWPAVAVLAVLLRRPLLAAAAIMAATFSSGRLLRRVGLPVDEAPARVATGLSQTWLGVGRYARQFCSPLVLTALLARPRRGRSLALLALLLSGPLASWWPRRAALDPARFCLAHVADDIAYGAGVQLGSWRARTVRPLRPKLVWRAPGRSR